ncbi:hypothetical protein D9X30_3490 [Cupriavidus sp. U2]|uniref:tail fiber assembly protein n=1 Tax=Cupriavidus sp. U2 TaxID=2920269 RepID=UPI001892BFAD|nr:tail fiber assembly protein [Cupriavidus sp. U2]KAI3591665.1 hypothetical protein D9X30_3490 [Cupriavidus sp. U2]
MDIHNYHPSTGQHLGIGFADENPLDPENPIVPGYATPTAPPAVQQGRVAVYRQADGTPPQNWGDGDWTIVPDYRAIRLFRTSDGTAFDLGQEYNGLGDLPPFLTDEPRPTAAHVWLNDEWALDEALETSQMITAATAKRDALLAEADQLIAPLMDGFVLDELSTEESALLKALSQYRKALRAVTGQAGFPRTINWPVKPA